MPTAVRMNRSLNLLYQTTRCAFLAQEKNSALGVIWHLLNPLAMTLVLYGVFSQVRLLNSIPDFGLFILVGVIHFNFFANTTTHTAQGIINSRNLILNSTVPLEILVLRSVCLEGATFLIELVLVGLFVAGFGPGLSWSAVQYVFVLAGLALLTFGASLLIASAVVFLTDLTYVWSIVTRMLFFLTPVFYPPDMMSHPLAAKVMVFNPLAQLVTLARASLIEGRWVDAGTVAASFAGPFGLTLVGWLVFRRTKPYVPDHI
jgi:ABC-type polysaccharide/polyol phosphate export permease